MQNRNKNNRNSVKINTIESTKAKITGRGGISLFVRYLNGIGIFPLMEKWFGSVRKSRKGLSVGNMFKQVFCYFMDGTKFTMTRFDELAEDEAYAASIENNKHEMSSSHIMKRFYKAFSFVMIWHFRWLLQELFIWRLRIEQPRVINLNIDTMVMDNDDAKQREGVKPTYMNRKGFQPLQLTWGPYIVDAVFRSGDKHSNNGDTVVQMVRHVVKKIRKKYSRDVMIILRSDSGFLDQENFHVFEDELHILYICGGKMYQSIKDYMSTVAPSDFHVLTKDKQAWEYIEFGSRLMTWDRFRRAIYCRPVYDDRQQLLEFARPDRVIYTNIGMDADSTAWLMENGHEDCLRTDTILRMFQDRGSDELVHRALKDFGTEQLPFEKFEPNATFYYTMLVSFFLYESFKRDVAADVVPPACYAQTFRRTLIDIGAKIIRTAHRIIVKINEIVFHRLSINTLWTRANSPPPLIMVT
jgi:hypothetical protein